MIGKLIDVRWLIEKLLKIFLCLIVILKGYKVKNI